MTSLEFKPKPLWQILGDEPPIEWRLEQEDLARRRGGVAPAQMAQADANETYGPPAPALVPMDLPGFGRTYFDPAVVPNMRDFIDRTRQAGVDVQFASGFRTTLGQTKLQDDPTATKPARPGNSLHEAGRAFDIRLHPIDANGRSHPLADDLLQQIVGEARQSGFGWGGTFRGSGFDPGHFYIEGKAATTGHRASSAPRSITNNGSGTNDPHPARRPHRVDCRFVHFRVDGRGGGGGARAPRRHLLVHVLQR